MGHGSIGRWALALLAVTVLTWPAVAGWEEDLREEIKAQHACDVEFLSHVVEREIEGRQVVIAKVQCRDRRAFDAHRPDVFAAFQFSECTSRETRTC